MYFEQENIMLKNVRGKADTDSFNEFFKKTTKIEHKKYLFHMWYQCFTKYCLLTVILISR